MKNQTIRQHNVSIEHAIPTFLQQCKARKASLHTLCEYENVLCDFFQGEGTEFVEDISKGSPLEYVEQISLKDIEDYKSRTLRQGVPIPTINRSLMRLQRFFRYCARMGYMDELEVEPLREE